MADPDDKSLSGSKQALFLLLVLAALVASLEVAARFMFHLPEIDRGIYQYAADPDLVYEHKPSSASTKDNNTYRINAQGLHADREYALSKPPGVFRIGIVGDSVAFLSSGKNYARILQEMLDARKSAVHAGFEVLDFSVSGYNSAQEQIVIQDKVLAFDPDLVLVGYCVNDMTFTDGVKGLERTRHPSSLGPMFHSSFLTMIQHRCYRFRFNWSKKYPGYPDVDAFFAYLKALDQGTDAQVLLLLFPRFAGSGYENHELEEPLKLAKKHGLDVMDQHALLGGADTRPLKLAPPFDNYHLNETGHRHVAQRIYDRIKDGL